MSDLPTRIDHHGMVSYAVTCCDNCPLAWRDVDPDGVGVFCEHPSYPPGEVVVSQPDTLPYWCPLRAASLLICTISEVRR